MSAPEDLLCELFVLWVVVDKARTRSRLQQFVFRPEISALLAYNTLFASMEEDLPVAGLLVGFSRSKPCFHLYRLSSSDGHRSMLEGKDSQCIDMMFLFIDGYLDRVKGYQNDPRVRETNTPYSELVCDGCPDRKLSEIIDRQIS